MINWSFPSNNYGQVTGLNDAGIETFRGSPWDSLAREINQNSCDAKDKNNPRPVEVHFNLFQVPSNHFPNKSEFIKVLKSCLEYWKGNLKTARFFENALSIMESEQISILKISDYNTTGLTGADDEHRGGWHNLIKSVGSSDKDSQSGGSFGIGKHAPFACSDLRTVFYGTKEMDGTTAFQGVSKLVTHIDINGETTQGTGYYGKIEKNKPIMQIEEVYEFFKRSEVGTDIFVAGFNEDNGWEEKIIKSVLENFFIAILDEKLIVKVGKTTINANSLLGLLEKHTKNDIDCLSYNYFMAYTLSSRHHFSDENFYGLGEVNLFVLPGKDLPKRIAMVRGTGMKIYDKGSFRTPFKFAGVLVAKGERINEFLRQTEPPSHNAWEPDRHEDPEYAKGMIRKLYSWVNDQVRSISIADTVEEMDVEGLSQYLPDHFDAVAAAEAEQNFQNSSEGEKTTPKDIEIEFNYRQINANTFSGIKEGAAADETTSEMGDDDHSQGIGVGDLGGEKESSGNGEGGRSDGQENGGDERDESSSESGNMPRVNDNSTSFNNKNMRLTHSRIFCMNPASGTYKVSLQVNEDSTGYVGIKVVGEVGGETASIKSALIHETGKAIDLNSNGRLGPIIFYKEKKCDLIVTLKESLRCALEVSIHAN